MPVTRWLRESVARVLTSPHDAHYALLSQIITSISNFATTALLIRSIGVSGFGQFSICFLLLMTIRNFHIGIILTSFSTIFPTVTAGSSRSYLSFAALLNFSFSIVAAFISTFLLFIFSHSVNIDFTAYAMPFFLSAILSVHVEYFRRYCFVSNSPRRGLLLDIVRYSLQIGFLFVVEAVQPQPTAIDALLCVALAAGVGTAAGALWYGRLSTSSRRWRYYARRHSRFAAWMTPQVALEAVQTSGVLIVAGALLGEGPLGTVRAIQSLANTVNLPLNAFQTIATSGGARTYKQGGALALTQYLNRMKWLAALMLAAISAFVLIFSEDLLYIVGIYYTISSFFLLLFFLALNACLLFRFFSAQYFNVIERPGVIFLSTVIGALVTAVVAPGATVAIGTTAIPLTYLSVALVNIIHLALVRASIAKAEAVKQ